MEWLFKEDSYTPNGDKNRFIDKSTLSLLSTLSVIKKMSNTPEGFMYNINPYLKFISTFIFVLILSLARNMTFILILDEIILIGVLILNKESVKRILSLSFLSIFFTGVILIPSILLGNAFNSFLILLKVLGSVMCAGVLSFSTKWNDIIKSLKLVFVPDIFIFVLDITLRYIYILSEMSRDMMYALKLRSIGRNNKKYISISSIMGSLFIRSKMMGDEMLSAMECRGFTGDYKSKAIFKLALRDALYGTIILLVVFMYLSFGR